jgi:putative flippase GtrA
MQSQRVENTLHEPPESKGRLMLKQAFRFGIVGVLNTVVGYGCYLLFLNWLRYEFAYAIAYVIGIAVSYVFSALYVFRQPLRPRAALYYPLVYLVQFLLGLVLLRLFVEMLFVSPKLALVGVTVLTMPVTFLLSRLIVHMK